MLKVMTCAIVLSFAMATGGAWAQGSPGMAAPKMSASDKQARSKACSDQANAKGLHGKARKKFRSACKRTGGNT